MEQIIIVKSRRAGTTKLQNELINKLKSEGVSVTTINKNTKIDSPSNRLRGIMNDIEKELY